jgi:RNA-splicing ligase RtcB
MIKLKGKYGEAIVYTDDIESEAISQIINLLNQQMAENAHIRIMPDVHFGASCVIGYTAKLTDKIVPNLIGVDIGCFTGETKVALADGRNISFLELIEEYKIGKSNYCFSIDKNSNKVVISKIENPHRTRTVKKLMKITIDNGEEIKCTLDHIFYTRSSEEIKAKDLSIGQSLMPFITSFSKDVERKNLSDKNKSGKRKEYKVVFNPFSELYDYVHVLADEHNISESLYEVEKNKNIRHHVDYNKYNNNPDNIKRVSAKEHWSEHAKIAELNNWLGISGFKKAWENNKEKFSKMSSIKMKRLHEREEFKSSLIIRAPKNIEEYNKSEDKKENDKLAGIRGAKYLEAFNKINNNTVYVCDKCGRQTKGLGGHKRHYYHCKNHKVVSIETIDVQDAPVYCLTISNYHNFALASGVFVHNCGVQAWKLGKRSLVGERFEKLDKFIRNNIPSGREIHEEPVAVLSDDKREACKRTCQDPDYVLNSIGTLGGGNHFIEVDRDQDDNLWLIVHTGSRNFGLKVAKFYQELAEQSTLGIPEDEYRARLEEIKRTKKGKGIEVAIQALRKEAMKRGKATGLEYLTLLEAKEYFKDMGIAQDYAQLNRLAIGTIILSEFYKIETLKEEVESIESVHNYINFEDLIIRKGSIAAHAGQKVIIPLNMADGVIIGVGKGNEEWNFSAPHGAGRRMSRSKAKVSIALEDFQAVMKAKGVWSSTADKHTLDEAPACYKKSIDIIKQIAPTVNIISHMQSVYNFKASE